MRPCSRSDVIHHTVRSDIQAIRVAMCLGLYLLEEAHLAFRWQLPLDLFIVHHILILRLQLPGLPMKPLPHPLIYLCTLCAKVLEGSCPQRTLIENRILNGCLTSVMLHIHEANDL
jgi:hypothetical protein